jgi:hypothetical protein
VTIGIVDLPLVSYASLAATLCIAVARRGSAVNLAAAFPHGHPHHSLTAVASQYCRHWVELLPLSSILVN